MFKITNTFSAKLGDTRVTNETAYWGAFTLYNTLFSVIELSDLPIEPISKQEVALYLYNLCYTHIQNMEYNDLDEYLNGFNDKLEDCYTADEVFALVPRNLWWVRDDYYDADDEDLDFD